MDDGNGVIFNMIYKGIELGFVPSLLTPGVAYTFKLSAYNFNGEGELSDPVTIKSCVAPIGVVAPTFLASTKTSVSLRWFQPQSDGGCSVLSYAVWRDDGLNGAFSVSLDPALIGNNPYIFEHTFVLPSTLSGLNVRFRLEATNERGSTLSGDFLSVVVAGVPA